MVWTARALNVMTGIQDSGTGARWGGDRSESLLLKFIPRPAPLRRRVAGWKQKAPETER